MLTRNPRQNLTPAAAGVLTGKQEKGAGLQEIDLGLSVKAYAFEGGWVTRLAEENKVQVRVEGDLLPHFFVLDDWCVFSTSPRLSRRIAGAKADQTERLELLGGERAPVVVGMVPSRTIGGSALILKSWGSAFMEHLAATARKEGVVLPQEARRADTLAAMDLMVDLMEWMGDIRWRTTQEGQEHVTRMAVGGRD